MVIGSIDRWKRAMLCASASLVSGTALAQQAPAPLPQTSQPGRDQITIPTPAPPRAATASVRGGGAIAQGPCPEEIATSDARVTLQRVRFVHPTGDPLPPEIVALLSGIAPSTGEQRIGVVCELRDRAVERLRTSGYVAAVQIPPQELGAGELTLNVITARLTQVRVIGDAGKFNSLLADRIEQLKRSDPLNEREAQRILLLAGDVPGLSVRLTLLASPSGRIGEVVGDLEVTYEPVVILANAQNFGSRALGRETGYVSASIAGLTGLADITTIAGSTTADFDEQLVGQIGHHFQVGHDGLTLGGNFTYAISRPDLDVLELRSRSMIGTLDVSFPLVRSINEAVRIGGGVDFIEQRTQVLGGASAIPLNRDRLRVAFLRADGSTQRSELALGRLEERHYFGGTLELRQGLSIFDASKRGRFQGNYGPSRPEGDPKAFVVRGAFDGRFRLKSAPIVFAASVQGQWSDAPLLNFEEYSLGNLTIGRGYDPGSNSADRAIALRGELRVPLRLATFEIEPFAFYDRVHIWNRDPGSTENDRRLRSFGGGARLKLPGLVYLEVMYAHPQDPALSSANVRRPTDRVLVSLTARFAPAL